MSLRMGTLTRPQIEKLPKGQLHEHLDCSLNPLIMLRLWWAKGFDNVNPPLPTQVVSDWQAAQDLRGRSVSISQQAAAERMERRAAAAYQEWLVGFASKSLKNYLDAIGNHVLPIMQTRQALYDITCERIKRMSMCEVGGLPTKKRRKGWLQLRFAPQLHVGGELTTLDQVMEPIVQAVKEAAIPVELIICSLRHEDQPFVAHNPIEELSDLAIKYPEVAAFDLAGGEAVFPGVLPWWLPAAKRVQAAGKRVTIHLWETNEPTDADLAALKELFGEPEADDKIMLSSAMRHVVRLCTKISATANPAEQQVYFDNITSWLDSVEETISRCGRIGHGIRGERQGSFILEVCPTSNVVTSQVASFAEHPVSKLFRQGKLVTINSDGTLFTKINLADEYFRLQEAPHRFGLGEFYVCNYIALAATSFSPEVKASLKAELTAGYRPGGGARGRRRSTK